MSKISVIVPVYKVEKYLKRCIDSILAQTFSDFELILVDDGSPDSCGQMCDEYAKKDERIKVIHKENGGLSSARNAGAKESVGQWIHFVDSDDVIHPRMLEILYNGVNEHGVKLSMCSYLREKEVPDSFYNLNSEKTVMCETDEKWLLDLRLNHGIKYNTACAKLIARDLVLSTPFTEGRFHEDTPVSAKWYYEAKSVANTDEKLYFYTANDKSIVSREYDKAKLDILWAREKELIFFKEKGYSSLCLQIFEEYICEACQLYRGGRKEKETREIANEARKKAKKFVKKNKEYCKVCSISCDYLRRLLLYPKWALIREYIIVAKNKIFK